MILSGKGWLLDWAHFGLGMDICVWGQGLDFYPPTNIHRHHTIPV